MQHYSYKTHKTCSIQIDFDLDEKKAVHNIVYKGGCEGNLKALPLLLEGMSADELVQKLSGITCGFKGTSCADQLANAVQDAALKSNK
ncbi:MAG: TIGR03905 family TSCPD domain-containing protein [Clostridia bacterium]|nr:TIGR03905 family TSCPD domain-containing protein [Clostridia bacterium]MDD4798372.1 TIGR03905 family TSCPD domain-containing protein [Clostridia bacterium]